MRFPLAVAIFLLAASAAACVNSTTGPGTIHPSTSTGTTSPSGPSISTPAGTFTVPCTSATTEGVAPKVPPSSARSGPVVFAGVYADRGRPADYRAVAQGKYAPTTMVVLVSMGKSAIVGVPKWERSKASLLFDPTKIHPGQAVSPSYGAPAVIFQSCPTTTSSPWVEYTGAVVLAGAHCTKLIVAPLKPGTHEPSQPQATLRIPYGRRSCPRR